MATRLGAKALHIGDLTGSLEPGKRADLILVDLAGLHTSPRFRRDPNGLYAQLVYTAKSSDVTRRDGERALADARPADRPAWTKPSCCARRTITPGRSTPS